jgi:hypothetical protein
MSNNNTSHRLPSQQGSFFLKTYSRIQDSQKFKGVVYPDLFELKIDHGNIRKSNFKSTVRRGQVKKFSKGSRIRMMKTLAKLESYPPYFLCLTYPAEYPKDKETIKRHLKIMKDHFEKRYPGCSGIWRLEIQKRGAPHFHFLLDIADSNLDIKKERQWLAKDWFDIVDSKDDKHLNAGTSFELLQNKKHIKYYISKYCAKTETEERLWGNWWGRVGKLNLSAGSTFNMDGKEVLLLRRLIKRWLKKKSPYYSKKMSFLTSFFLLANSSFIEKIIDYINNISGGSFVFPFP